MSKKILLMSAKSLAYDWILARDGSIGHKSRFQFCESLSCLIEIRSGPERTQKIYYAFATADLATLRTVASVVKSCRPCEFSGFSLDLTLSLSEFSASYLHRSYSGNSSFSVESKAQSF